MKARSEKKLQVMSHAGNQPSQKTRILYDSADLNQLCPLNWFSLQRVKKKSLWPDGANICGPILHQPVARPHPASQKILQSHYTHIFAKFILNQSWVLMIAAQSKMALGKN